MIALQDQVKLSCIIKLTVGWTNVSAYFIAVRYDGMLLLHWGYACRQYLMTPMLPNPTLTHKPITVQIYLGQWNGLKSSLSG